MIKFKKGTKVSGIRPELVLAILIAEGVYDKYDTNLVITSIVDGKHSYTSLHYSGSAFDVRTRNIPKIYDKAIMAGEIRESLSDEYDVVVESNHIHIEYQPKGKLR